MQGWAIKTNDGVITTFDDFFAIINSHFGNIDDVMTQVNEWYNKGVLDKSSKLKWG